MKVKKSNVNYVWYYIGALFIVVIIVYILFKYTPLNSIFDVYEGLVLDYANAGVNVESANSPQYIQDNFKEIDNINRNQTILVPSIAASIHTDSAPLLSQFLKIKQNIERTYPNTITILTKQQSKDYKVDDTQCSTSITDINDIYQKITWIVYSLQGIKDISDVTKNASKVVAICSGEDSGLRYYLKRVRESMTAYIDKTKQNPISSNGQKIVNEFKQILGPINNFLYQVEDMFIYNAGDTNTFVNNIKTYIKNYADNDKYRNLPPGAWYTRQGRCLKDSKKRCKL
jgi:hypothetical protein